MDINFLQDLGIKINKGVLKCLFLILFICPFKIFGASIVSISNSEKLLNHSFNSHGFNINHNPSRDATLASLLVTNSSGFAYTLSPARFDPSLGFYTLKVINTVDVINVQPNANASVISSLTVNGTNYSSGSIVPIGLILGDNTTITIVVTAEDGITTNTYVLTVSRAATADQNFTFGSLPTVAYGTADFDPGAAVSSNLPISYTSDNLSVATILNNKIHVVGVGNANITATVEPSNSFTTKDPISQKLTVVKASQVISNQIIGRLLKGNTVDLSGFKASSGLPVIFSISDTSIASITGNTLLGKKLGTCTLTVSQDGDNNFKGAIPLTRNIKVDDLKGDDIIVHQAVTPNGDGRNDFLLIEGLSTYESNTVTIANTYGTIVYSNSNYNNSTIRFDGHINGQYLPSGTYFYYIEYVSFLGEKHHKTGYIVLKY